MRTRSFLACLIFQEQWCDRHGSVAEVRSNLHMKHEGAAKRERAIAYAVSHQVHVVSTYLSSVVTLGYTTSTVSCS